MYQVFKEWLRVPNTKQNTELSTKTSTKYHKPNQSNPNNPLNQKPTSPSKTKQKQWSQHQLELLPTFTKPSLFLPWQRHLPLCRSTHSSSSSCLQTQQKHALQRARTFESNQNASLARFERHLLSMGRYQASVRVSTCPWFKRLLFLVIPYKSSGGAEYQKSFSPTIHTYMETLNTANSWGWTKYTELGGEDLPYLHTTLCYDARRICETKSTTCA